MPMLWFVLHMHTLVSLATIGYWVWSSYCSLIESIDPNKYKYTLFDLMLLIYTMHDHVCFCTSVQLIIAWDIYGLYPSYYISDTRKVHSPLLLSADIDGLFQLCIQSVGLIHQF